MQKVLMEAILVSLVRIFDVCVKVCHRISFEEFLNQLQRVLEAASKIFCEFYSLEDPARTPLIVKIPHRCSFAP